MTKDPKSRIRNVIGQLEAVERMMNEKEDCQKVTVQLKAAKSALSAAMSNYVEEQAVACVESGTGQKNITKKLSTFIHELAR